MQFCKVIDQDRTGTSSCTFLPSCTPSKTGECCSSKEEMLGALLGFFAPWEEGKRFTDVGRGYACTYVHHQQSLLREQKQDALRRCCTSQYKTGPTFPPPSLFHQKLRPGTHSAKLEAAAAESSFPPSFIRPLPRWVNRRRKMRWG